MSKIRFEWDPEKERINRHKHGITFQEAHSVFYDENAIEYFDPDHSGIEDRFLLLGMSFTTCILVVSHCIRNKSIIRIISARKATNREADVYLRGKL